MVVVPPVTSPMRKEVVDMKPSQEHDDPVQVQLAVDTKSGTFCYPRVASEPQSDVVANESLDTDCWVIGKHVRVSATITAFFRMIFLSGIALTLTMAFMGVLEGEETLSPGEEPSILLEDPWYFAFARLDVICQVCIAVYFLSAVLHLFIPIALFKAVPKWIQPAIFSISITYAGLYWSVMWSGSEDGFTVINIGSSIVVPFVVIVEVMLSRMPFSKIYLAVTMIIAGGYLVGYILASSQTVQLIHNNIDPKDDTIYIYGGAYLGSVLVSGLLLWLIKSKQHLASDINVTCTGKVLVLEGADSDTSSICSEESVGSQKSNSNKFVEEEVEKSGNLETTQQESKEGDKNQESENVNEDGVVDLEAGRCEIKQTAVITTGSSRDNLTCEQEEQEIEQKPGFFARLFGFGKKKSEPPSKNDSDTTNDEEKVEDNTDTNEEGIEIQDLEVGSSTSNGVTRDSDVQSQFSAATGSDYSNPYR